MNKEEFTLKLIELTKSVAQGLIETKKLCSQNLTIINDSDVFDKARECLTEEELAILKEVISI